MEYLMKDLSPKKDRQRMKKGLPLPVAHLWEGLDTYCRMYSTGGITAKIHYRVSSSSEGRQVCTMCQGEEINRQLASAIERDR
jgi:hypothetical protein